MLLEGTPSDVNVADLQDAIKKIDGVKDVHDLHVWALTSGMNAMSAHVAINEGISPKTILESIQQVIKADFKISHTTIQIEEPGFAEEQIAI